MAQVCGSLEPASVQVGENDIEILRGDIAVPELIKGQVMIVPKRNKTGAQWPFDVRVRFDGTTYNVGSAKWERKNERSDFYLTAVIETPVIQKKIDAPLWVKIFPQSEIEAGKRDPIQPFGADSYDIVYGRSGGGKKNTSSMKTAVMEDDEIPFQ